MSFKFLRGTESDFLTTNNQIQFYQPSFQNNNVEFCFQFDDNEPVPFGVGPNDLHIHITPTPNGNIVFTDSERKFKIFARERQ